MASTQPTDSLLQAVRIELKQSPPAPAVADLSPPPEGDGGLSADGHHEHGARGAVITEAHDSEGAVGAQLLVTDARTAFILANHLRKRVVIRIFGVSPENVNAVTVIGLLVIADAAHNTLAHLRTAGRPTRSDALLAGGSARAVVGMVAGPAIDETPGLGTLITVAFLAHAARLTAKRSLGALRSGSHRATFGFHHRYGYLVDPGHRREQRARRRGAEPGLSGRGDGD